METSEPDLRLVEPPSPDGLMPTPLDWWAWSAIGIGVLILVIVAFLAWRRSRRGTITSKADLREEARKAALAALALCPTHGRTEAATECSIILRRYLVKLTGDRALFETHEEWVARHDSIEGLSDDLKQQIHELFSRLAQSKYAPADHGDEPQQMIENSVQLVETINREVGR